MKSNTNKTVSHKDKTDIEEAQNRSLDLSITKQIRKRKKLRPKRGGCGGGQSIIAIPDGVKQASSDLAEKDATALAVGAGALIAAGVAKKGRTPAGDETSAHPDEK